jgi:hypothetical protein
VRGHSGLMRLADILCHPHIHPPHPAHCLALPSRRPPAAKQRVKEQKVASRTSINELQASFDSLRT